MSERYSAYCAQRPRHLAVHGADIVDNLESFYAAVVDLFAGGNLGGLRIVARRPA